MNTFHTGCPVVKRSQEIFVQRINIGGEPRRVEFTKDILWIQASEVTVQFLHGGQVLKEGRTYNDFYGYLTSFDREACRVCEISEQYSITSESSLELVLLATVFLDPATETKETIKNNRDKPSNYKSMYAYVPDDWRKEVIENGDTFYPQLERIVLGSDVVWSSRNTPEQNSDLVRHLKQRWRAEEAAVAATA